MPDHDAHHEPNHSNAFAGLADATVVVAAGRPARTPGAPANPPVVFSSTYTAGGDIGYARVGNPTWDAFEEAVGALEGGRALSFSSGMGAVSCVLDLVPLGSLVVAPRSPYSGVRELLELRERQGHVRVRWVDIADSSEVAQACDGAALLWIESPTNPMLEVCDLPACVSAGRAVGALVVVDNTFATPLVQRPLDHGADVVIHSATKYLSGHSDLLMGVAITRDAEQRAYLASRRTLLGSVPGPMETWLALRGLRTLALRVERSQDNAAELARRLVNHPAVVRVRYPGLPGDPGHHLAQTQMRGFGSIVSIETRGDANTAESVGGYVRLWAHATSLGGVESSLERRRRWPAEPNVVPETLIRLSVGIEDVEDLWADLSQALDRAVGPVGVGGP